MARRGHPRVQLHHAEFPFGRANIRRRRIDVRNMEDGQRRSTKPFATRETPWRKNAALPMACARHNAFGLAQKRDDLRHRLGFIRNLIVHLAEKTLPIHILTFGGLPACLASTCCSRHRKGTCTPLFRHGGCRGGGGRRSPVHDHPSRTKATMLFSAMTSVCPAGASTVTSRLVSNCRRQMPRWDVSGRWTLILGPAFITRKTAPRKAA